ncbi:uroporphyrinogen-III C-methyltransferase [candidate division KSB1 bacterium]
MTDLDTMKKVYLIGAGPGNTYLITVRAQTLLMLADVVIYDYLANDILLEFTSPSAEKIYVGKQAGCHVMEQDEINRLLKEKVESGRTVVRLKGGDPFVFGRGGEEAIFLKKEGIPFEIVPGVTSATAALAYAGIPITHRGLSSCATIITGHEDPEKQNSDINWDALAGMNGTLVFFMGVKRLPKIVEKLICHGKPASTPAAVVRSGTTPQQQTVTGTLENITEKVEKAGLQPPGLIVVGDVVQLRDSLKWFESLPLFGMSILITRSVHQAKNLSEQLSVLGAEVIHRPTINILPPEDCSALDECLKRGGDFDWVIFTSTNGIQSFAERLRACDLDIRVFVKAKFAGIGAATRRAIRGLGVRVDFAPRKFTSAGFVEEFQQMYPDLTGQKILFPAADIARDIIPEELSRLGAVMTRVTAYRTVAPDYQPEEFTTLFERHTIDLITFTSSSTVENLIDIFEKNRQTGLIDEVRAASIGPMTTKTLREHGIEPVLEAKVHTIEGLVEEIIEYNRARKDSGA